MTPHDLSCHHLDGHKLLRPNNDYAVVVGYIAFLGCFLGVHLLDSIRVYTCMVNFWNRHFRILLEKITK